jgi:hypothetical protein
MHLKEPCISIELCLVLLFGVMKPYNSFVYKELHLTSLTECLLLIPESKNNRDFLAYTQYCVCKTSCFKTVDSFSFGISILKNVISTIYFVILFTLRSFNCDLNPPVSSPFEKQVAVVHTPVSLSCWWYNMNVPCWVWKIGLFCQVIFLYFLGLSWLLWSVQSASARDNNHGFQVTVPELFSATYQGLQNFMLCCSDSLRLSGKSGV